MKAGSTTADYLRYLRVSNTIRRRGVVLAAALMISLQPLSALASGPDTSNHSSVEYPYQNTSSNLIHGSSSSYVGATAAASNDLYALLGSGPPRLTTSLGCSGFPIGCGNLISSATYEANPVYVIGPWDGSASGTEIISPPINAMGVEEFGSALAIQGSRIAIGASSVFSWTHSLDASAAITVTTTKTASGRVHLYQSNVSTISPEQTIVYGGLNDEFGAALALDANHLLVGRPGASPSAADLFDPDTGTLVASLISPGSADRFGEKVALAGDLAVVAAPSANTVYVYRHDGGGNWNPAGTLDSPGVGSEFGFSVAADGERIIVGAPALDRAYIYEDDGDANWPVVAELSGGATSRLGTAVAIVGEVAFVSAPQLLISGSRIGLVVRHEKGDGSWPFTGVTNAGQVSEGYGKLISASATLLTVWETGGSDLTNNYHIYTAPHLIWDPDGTALSNFSTTVPLSATATRTILTRTELEISAILIKITTESGTLQR